MTVDGEKFRHIIQRKNSKHPTYMFRLRTLPCNSSWQTRSEQRQQINQQNNVNKVTNY